MQRVASVPCGKSREHGEQSVSCAEQTLRGGMSREEDGE